MQQQDQISLRIGFVGAGRVAKGLAWGLAQSRHSVVAAASRSIDSAQQLAVRIAGCRATANAQDVVDAADLIFLTVPDDAIAAVVSSLRWRQGVAAVHCSGATEVAVLEPAARSGARIGGFHPLQLFGDPDVALAGLPGCTVAIEAEAPLLSQLELLATDLRCRSICLPHGCRVRYHVAAHYAAGFVIALMKQATDLWQSFGIGSEETIRALLPLLRGTADSVERSGLAQGLAGTYSRGDVGTLEKHLAELGHVGSDALQLYCELGLRSIPLGLERGGYDEKTAEAMRALLRRALVQAREESSRAGPVARAGLCD
jgi:predicted short-subunit dehydrogenase-like oxidoreductase (DUF2520 family)